MCRCQNLSSDHEEKATLSAVLESCLGENIKKHTFFRKGLANKHQGRRSKWMEGKDGLVVGRLKQQMEKVQAHKKMGAS